MASNSNLDSAATRRNNPNRRNRFIKLQKSHAKHKRRQEALNSISTQIAFYNTFVSAFERQPNQGLLYPMGVSIFTPSATTSTTKLHFLELPTELRVQIYTYLLPTNSTIRLRKRNLTTRGPYPITLVSKPIRKESLSTYFSSNTFIIRVQMLRLEALATWVRSITLQCGPRAFNPHVRFEIKEGGFAHACEVFPLMNMIRRRKLVVPVQQLFYNHRKIQASNRLPLALNELARTAVDIGRRGKSGGKLISCMERIFEENIRCGNAVEKDLRLEQVREQCAVLRREIAAMKKDRKKA